LDNNLLNAKVYVLSILLEANMALILLNKVSGRVNRSTVRQRWWPKEICPAEILVEIILSQGIMGYNSRDDLPLRCNIGFPRCGSKLCLKKCVLALPRPCSIAMRGA